MRFPEHPLNRAKMVAVVWCLLFGASAWAQDNAGGLTLLREDHWLYIRGPHLPAGGIQINYLEAYCRAGSTKADWVAHTVIPHKSELLWTSGDQPNGECREMRLRDTLADGLVVEHTIRAGRDEVDFRLEARNPKTHRSEAHWAQPCVRVGEFTGFGPKETSDAYAYVPKCFIFIDGKLTRMPTSPWATEARYTPGQIWRPEGVPADDVNPRPVSALRSSNGLIGCFSGDEKWIFATAWEPYQELFQGVGRCVHSDFRLGGIGPGESKIIRGKIYVLPADMDGLLKRYARDFPEQAAGK